MGSRLRANGDQLRAHHDELRLHGGLLEHVIQEQTLTRAATQLVAERVDRLTEAVVRGRTDDLERARSHELRISRLEERVFGATPAPDPSVR